MTNRYILADQSQISYAIEDTAYTKKTPANKYFGYLSEDIDFPSGQNPTTMLKAKGTTRAPYVHSPDQKDYEFSLPIIPLDHNIPLEIALGERTITDQTTYERHLFDEADLLPTATIEHIQKDLDFVEWYIGSKANLNISGAVGEPINVTLDIVSAKHDWQTGLGEGVGEHEIPALGLPKSKVPYMFWMTCGVKRGSDDLATINSFDIGVDNGLTPRHHGCGRDAYAIAEETSADKYDCTLGLDIIDLDLWTDAVENNDMEDIEIPIVRQLNEGGTVILDGIIIRLKDCKVEEAFLNSPAEGMIESDVKVSPLAIEIEIRKPTP